MPHVRNFAPAVAFMAGESVIAVRIILPLPSCLRRALSPARGMGLGMAAIALAVLAWAAPASAAPATAAGKPRLIVLRPRFKPLPGNTMLGDGRYVLISGTTAAAAGTATLIDGQTGRTTRITPGSGCGASALGGSRIVFTCGLATQPTLELYDIPTRHMQPLAASPEIGYAGCSAGCWALVAVGADWAAYEVGPVDPHSLPFFEFQNLAGGQVLPDPTDASTTVDLSSPRLTEKVCRPPHVPVVSTAYSRGWGSLTFDHGYAISAGGAAFLERCGSRLHQFLTFTLPTYLGDYPLNCPHLACPPASNANVIVWAASDSVLKGVFLPDRRRFTIPIPSRAMPPGGGDASSYQVALTAKTLYLRNDDGRIWTSPAPAEPGSRRRHGG